MRHTTVGFVSILLCILLNMISAWAEDSPGTSEQQQPVTSIAEIVVTASRTSEQEEHNSTATIQNEDLRNADIKRTEDIGARIPSLNIVQPGDGMAPVYSMRGLVNNTLAFGEQTVQTSVDGIPTGDLLGLTRVFLDVDHIDVVRGAQISACGKHAEAGAINITTCQPTNKFEGEAEADYGNYNTQFYQASLRGPICQDKAFFSVGLYENSHDGYITNTYLHTHPDYDENWGARLNNIFLPTPELRISLLTEIDEDRGGAPMLAPYNHHESTLTVDDGFIGRRQRLQIGGGLRIEYTTPDFIISSTTAGHVLTVDPYRFDLSLSPTPTVIFNANQEVRDWSQQLDACSVRKGPWQWHTGAYFEGKYTDVTSTFDFVDPAFIQAPPPAGLGLPFDGPVYNSQSGKFQQFTAAWYGETTFSATENLEINLGMRQEYFEMGMDRGQTIKIKQLPAATTSPSVLKSVSSDTPLPTLSASYNCNDDLSFFVKTARGYRPGGLSYFVADESQMAWRPEHVWDYEAGTKTEWLSKKLTLNATAFYLDIDDFQVRRLAVMGLHVVNAARAHSAGCEMDMDYQPLKALAISCGAGATDARYDKFVDPVSNTVMSGNRIQLSPACTLSPSVQYKHASGFLARMDYQLVGPEALTEKNDEMQRTLHFLGARVGYEKKNFGVYLFGGNLLDRRYSQMLLTNLQGNGYISSEGEPRTFGISATLKF
jgi:iron complex outermembrane receptor protein